jgi:hypothetical protein
MLIVGTELVLVEAELVGGLLGCPSCRGVLGPWGHARERVLRCRSGDRLLRPRRARCRGCAGTHVSLFVEPPISVFTHIRATSRRKPCGRLSRPPWWIVSSTTTMGTP